jgi:hypothetical protein
MGMRLDPHEVAQKDAATKEVVAVIDEVLARFTDWRIARDVLNQILTVLYARYKSSKWMATEEEMGLCDSKKV